VKIASWNALLLGCWFLGEVARAADPVLLEGVVVTPHLIAPRMIYQKPKPTELGARVDLVLRSTSDQPISIAAIRFDGQDPESLRKKGTIAWHSLKGLPEQPTIPPGGHRHIALNGRRADWGVGSQHTIDVDLGGSQVSIPFRLAPPERFISAITYLGSGPGIYPNRAVVHLTNDASEEAVVQSVRLFTPSQPSQWMNFDQPAKILEWKMLPQKKAMPAKDRAVVEISFEPLPLTYGLLAVDLLLPSGRKETLWGRTRIKRESFDISGGWVVNGTPFGLSVTYEPFLKLLKRIHVNTAHYQGTPGYSDQSAESGLYARYPLKYFSNLKPVEEFDRDELLPRIHAAEWLGEPQYPNPEDNESPQRVYDEASVYAPSRLATTVTLSDESTWRYYAGLTDFPHYDAYRVVAPHVDAWPKYDRWEGKKIYWGSPLETIGDMTRSLRDLSRPAPTAYWAQGPADGWKGFDGRRRRSPTPDELRSQAYHALAQRITSLYWFNLSPRSLVMFRDTLDELGRVGREIRMLDHFYLEGDATDYRVQPSTTGPGWDLSTISSPRGSLLFALDLEYRVDTKERVFAFPDPRPMSFDFALPGYLRTGELDVFRVDADGVHEVKHSRTQTGVRIDDVRSNVGIYVAAHDRSVREETARRQQELVAGEEALSFDPARNDADFELLARMIDKK
jgi:hypothetical protein